jgi:hypothetical protein
VCPIFWTAKSVRQLTTFATHSTTKSPQKHSVYARIFRKNLTKTLIHHGKKNPGSERSKHKENRPDRRIVRAVF